MSNGFWNESSGNDRFWGDAFGVIAAIGIFLALIALIVAPSFH